MALKHLLASTQLQVGMLLHVKEEEEDEEKIQ